MKPQRTQARVYKNVNKHGTDIVLTKRTKLETPVTLKALIIEDPSQLPFRFRTDYKDMPNTEAAYFLVGIPPEAKRDVDNNPVTIKGVPYTLEEYPEPEKTRSSYIRSLMPQGRKFISNEVEYTVKREIPLSVSNVNLYLLYICDGA